MVSRLVGGKLPGEQLAKLYAPINIIPHYPPGPYRGNSGAFDLVLTLKVASYVGKLTRTITHVQKCVIK